MNEYYGELFAQGDPVIAAGWRHRLEQALRFEIALESLPLAASGEKVRLLDVGCGPGSLWAYLEATGRGAGAGIAYTGIDRLEEAVALARRQFPAGEFVHQDVFAFGAEALKSPERKFDAVIASGTLVSGVEAVDGAARVHRLEQLVAQCFSLSCGVFCLVVLNQAVVECRVVLRAEAALLGAHAAELHALGQRLVEQEGAAQYAVREDFLTTDLALYVWREGTVAAGFLEGAEPFAAHDAVLAGPWGKGATRQERAWLWLEAGAYARADAALNAEPRLEGEQADLLRARLELMRG